MADSDWVLQAKVTAGLDLDAVVRWWFDPARRAEFWQRWRDMNLRNFYWIDADTESIRVREFGWAGEGFIVAHRLETFLPPDHLPGPTLNGYLVEGSDHITVRYTNGRVVTVHCANKAQFSSSGQRLTTVAATHQHHKTGGRWWERHLPPTAERSVLRKKLREEMVRCARALSDGSVISVW